jgi:opacity protein-like surface antigen
MKNKLIFITLASMLLFVTESAIAGSADETYIGVQYAVGNYDENGISEDFNPTVFVGRFGRYFTPNFSVEGRLGLGLQDDTQFLPEFGVGGMDATLELDSIIGVYATGHINLTESTSIYGLLGVSRVKGATSVPAIPGLKSTEDNSGLSYGIGADVGIGNNVALNIEYVQYLDKSDFDLGMLGLGVVFSF